MGGCGFLDGEKLICMDGLYEDVINNNCLVYSFGVGKYDLEAAFTNVTKLILPNDFGNISKSMPDF